MAARDRAPSRPSEHDRYHTFSIAVDLIRRGETVLTLIDPGRADARVDWFPALSGRENVTTWQASERIPG